MFISHVSTQQGEVATNDDELDAVFAHAMFAISLLSLLFEWGFFGWWIGEVLYATIFKNVFHSSLVVALFLFSLYFPHGMLREKHLIVRNSIPVWGFRCCCCAVVEAGTSEQVAIAAPETTG